MAAPFPVAGPPPGYSGHQHPHPAVIGAAYEPQQGAAYPAQPLVQPHRAPSAPAAPQGYAQAPPQVYGQAVTSSYAQRRQRCVPCCNALLVVGALGFLAMFCTGLAIALAEFAEEGVCTLDPDVMLNCEPRLGSKEEEVELHHTVGPGAFFSAEAYYQGEGLSETSRHRCSQFAVVERRGSCDSSYELLKAGRSGEVFECYRSTEDNKCFSPRAYRFSRSTRSGVGFGMVGAGVVFGITCMVCLCCRCRQQRRRQKQELQQGVHGGSAAAAAVGGGSGHAQQYNGPATGAGFHAQHYNGPAVQPVPAQPMPVPAVQTQPQMPPAAGSNLSYVTASQAAGAL